MEHILPQHPKHSAPRTPAQWEEDRPLAEEILRHNYTRYRGFDKELKADPAIAKAYLSQFGWGFPDLPLSLRSNFAADMPLKCELAIAAIAQNPRAVTRIPFFLLEQPPVREAALRTPEFWSAEKLDAHIAKQQQQEFGIPFR